MIIKKTHPPHSIKKFLSSNTFFRITLALFMLQSLWVAFSFKHPMLFDEEFHYGLIKVFSNHLWPIIDPQPIEYDYLRHISREGSYLFHYLFSYVYRLMDVFTLDETAKIIGLRILNISLFSLGIIKYRDLLRRASIPNVYINLSFVVFIFIPVATWVSATINYDNLIFLIIPVFLIRLVNILQKKDISKNLYFGTLLALVGVLVKFTFVPIVFAGILALLLPSFKYRSIIKGVQLLSSEVSQNKIKFILLTIPVFLSLAWVTHIYGYNTARYYNPLPSCPTTLSPERCAASPIVNNVARLSRLSDSRPETPLVSFPFIWSSQMFISLFGTANSTTEGVVDYSLPLTVISVGYFILFILGVANLSYFMHQLVKNRVTRLLLLVFLINLGVIFFYNLKDYLIFNVGVAIQGRYMAITLPLILAPVVYSLGQTIRASSIRIVLILLTVLVITQGGGLITHIMLSKDNWYWQNNYVINANNDAKRYLNGIVRVN
jgi:hypothetical protein